jgi:hypothetical protein
VALRASSSSSWAPRLTPKNERQPLIIAGLVALALLGLGEATPGAFPVRVSIEGHGPALQVSVDGQQHAVLSVLGPGWLRVDLQEPGPLEREYQVDGSDTTSTDDRQPRAIADLLGTPLYLFDAWLRDESSYSRWEHVRIVDLATGVAVSGDSALPADFRVEAALRRPEAPARLWLVAADDRREGLELDRDRRNARWLIQRGGGTDMLPRWFFPEQPAPFVAELMHLVGRAAAAGYALALAALVFARFASLASGLAPKRPGGRHRRTALGGNGSGAGAAGGADDGGSRDAGRRRDATFGANPARGAHAAGAADAAGGADATRGAGAAAAGGTDDNGGRERAGSGEPLSPAWVSARLGGLVRTGPELLLGIWLIAAALVTTRLYHQLPHILDAVSYTFQARVFASGQLALDAPPLAPAFKGPFEVFWQGRIFSQYPPGAPAVYALGQTVGLAWLVGPLACLALIGATAWTARSLFGPACGLVVLCLGVLSPFVLFQAGSFLSHPIAGGLLACALAAFVKAEGGQKQGWYILSGGLLGAAFTTREAASALFALPLVARLLATRRWQALLLMAACGLPFVLAYLLYNEAVTSNPLLLPRTIFNPADQFGFGDGIGFHTRHTLAAGLANTDELLTILQFDLFGWPPLFALGLLAVPFLFGRARTWDILAACGALAFVLAYTGYFYHGIALGPRYYFEAMPWLLLLAGRGAQVLAQVARSRAAAAVVLGLLSLNSLFFYLPAEIHRRTDFSAMPGGRKVSLGFVRTSIFGPRLVGLPNPGLVVTDDWWLYNTSLVALNCARLPDCHVLFALATSPRDLDTLRAQFPDRTVLRTIDRAGRIDVVGIGS